MPRRGGGRSARAAPRPAKTSPPPKPAPKEKAKAPAGFGSSFLGTIADGIGWGTGNAIAHRAMDAVMGPRTIRQETVASEAAASKSGADACSVHSKAFQDCLNGYGNEISKCQLYMDMLTECKRNSASGNIHWMW